MKNKFNVKDLQNFESEVIRKYKEGNTYGPVHLSGSEDGSQEEALINIFKKIDKKDWVFTTHRSHYHALLKSQNKKWLMNEIIVKAQSSHINSKKYKIFSSAIVGGIIPIALGVAMGIKLTKGKEKVWCFIGDMAAHMGQFLEAVKYSYIFALPITFVIEDNGLGCNTPTEEVWSCAGNPCLCYNNVIKYKYKRKYPHYGIGEWIIFKDKKVKGVGDYNAYK